MEAENKSVVRITRPSDDLWQYELRHIISLTPARRLRNLRAELRRDLSDRMWSHVVQQFVQLDDAVEGSQTVRKMAKRHNCKTDCI